MNEIIPMEKWHYTSLFKTGKYFEVFRAKLLCPEAIEAMTYPGTAYSIMVDGKLAGAGGVSTLWDGVGEAWAYITPELRKARWFLTKQAKAKIIQIQKEFKFHRIHCYVQSDFYEGSRWAKALGFKFEGPLNQWGPDRQSFNLFVKLWPTQQD